MADVVEHIDGSIIQHGAFNNRIYLMRLNTVDIEGLIVTLEKLSHDNGYGKILAKIPATAWSFFKTAGFLKEAVIPGFFNGRIDGYFIAKYFSASRQNDTQVEHQKKALGLNGAGTVDPIDLRHRTDQAVVSCQASDAEEISKLYRMIFQSYPFPIHQPVYLKQMIDKGVRYFGIRKAGRLVAVAATEIDPHAENAEMTDFATRPEWRDKGFAEILLRHMDRKVAEMGLKTTYTIARVGSAAINRVFQRRGYAYAGWLKNNTQIGGRIESMAVWYKRLS
jgi:putative beta-lysine N-acetyltransferase